MKLFLRIKFYFRKMLALFFASPIPPEITKFYLVDLDPIELKRQADTEGTIQILLNKKEVKITIEPSMVLANDCEAVYI